MGQTGTIGGLKFSLLSLLMGLLNGIRLDLGEYLLFAQYEHSALTDQAVVACNKRQQQWISKRIVY